ncbi:carbamoyl-phosphate synthase (glutamine-hydrolyzing) large subunit [Alkalicoccus luteus]|uniref:carbamoyl-phosphate synthase (glutamine-hydrolyzing) large subunit n=1 Tax=Alkalicoccus luteus TaxID=1237094 RepID=UPI004034AE8F
MCSNINTVLVIGSGPIIIGQAAEFDYAGTQACLALKEAGKRVILVNNNPATIMTDTAFADKTYLEPLTVSTLESIIKKERPDGLIGTLGGQTGLNLTAKLYRSGILDAYGVKVMGTSVESIEKGEDRELFRSLMIEIEEPVIESEIVESVEAGLHFAASIGYPVILRPAYTLGGAGGGFAHSEEEMKSMLAYALKESPIHQVLVEKSIKGWKEVEYEVMRDANDTCIIVCNMENMDPVGVHTGDSIVVAPSQTLTDSQYQMLRESSLKVIRALDVVGGCNIQFALHPETDEYAIIEVNPRVSRSSALASKATGYPIARIAALTACGQTLDRIPNPITGNTFASFEPALDYIVVKLPRFPFDKFSEADRSLGTQMKATGEVMALERTFESAFLKAMRSMETGSHSPRHHLLASYREEKLKEMVMHPEDLRVYAVYELLIRGWRPQQITDLSGIHPWFLTRLEKLCKLEKKAASQQLSTSLLTELKQAGFSDKLIGDLQGVSESKVRQLRKDDNLKPGYKLVDTCAGEFEAVTPYYYSTWHGEDEVTPTPARKVLVVGSGPIRIGQGVEFDYCSVHAAEAVKALGYEAVVINNNPETVSTDFNTADRLYFEPLTAEDVIHVAEKEQVEAVLLQFGGQTAVNLAQALEEHGLPVAGTSADAIELLENRESFYHLLDQLNVAHIKGTTADSKEDVLLKAEKTGYPVLVRPSYVIGGQAMYICHNEHDLQAYLDRLEWTTDARCWPLMVDAFIAGKEFEADVISDGTNLFIPGFMEHVERAGVHSGDSFTIYPSTTIPEHVKAEAAHICELICRKAGVSGMMNIQFVYDNEVLYVLEVNPRASRTVPVISKVSGTNLVREAVAAQLHFKLSKTGLIDDLPHITVKAPVFSSAKLKQVDPMLSPEMKSTGEKIGIASTLAEAAAKVLDANSLQTCYISAADAWKMETADLPLEHLELFASKSTAESLRANNWHVTDMSLDEAEQAAAEGKLDAVLNVPTAGRMAESAGFRLRQTCIAHGTMLFTHPDTFRFYRTYAGTAHEPLAVQDLFIKEEIQ